MGADMSYQVEEFDDAKKFIKRLVDKSLDVEAGWEVMFRGHNKAEHKLIPTLYRENSVDLSDYASVCSTRRDEGLSKVEFEQQLRHVISNVVEDKQKKDNLCNIVLCALVEAKSQTEFLKLANQTNLSVTTLNHIKIPPRISDAVKFLWEAKLEEIIKNFIDGMNSFPLKTENLIADACIGNIYNRLKRELCEYEPGGIPSSWFEELISGLCENDYGSFDTDAFSMRALARHHGMPSRLLDWTKNPWVAAFFSQYNKNDEVDDVCVWVLEFFRTEDYRYDNVIILRNDFIQKGLEFLIQQDGVLMELKHVDAYRYQYDKWPCVNEYLEKFDDAGHYKLEKFVLRNNQVSNLRLHLNAMGYSLPKLMPSYDNVALAVKSSLLSSMQDNF